MKNCDTPDGNKLTSNGISLQFTNDQYILSAVWLNLLNLFPKKSYLKNLPENNSKNFSTP